MNNRCILLTAALMAALPATHLRAAPSYIVVGTGQTKCYDNYGEIDPPRPGQPFYGQDAQFTGPQPRYRDNGDGTVTDLNTGLMWVQGRGAKLTCEDAIAGASACRAGGHSDWRMPTIKELYSLINFTGECHGPEVASKPFVDTRYFRFVYGNPSKGERAIDCQDWSATEYVSTTMDGNPTVFGVNFADGRIKGYPKTMRRREGPSQRRKEPETKGPGFILPLREARAAPPRWRYYATASAGSRRAGTVRA